MSEKTASLAQQLIDKIFSERYRPGLQEVAFTRDDLIRAAEELGAARPKNLGDVVYSLPAASTLTVPADNNEPPDVWFQIHGVNLNLDADGNVESITDGPGVLAACCALCEAQGLPRPSVVT